MPFLLFLIYLFENHEVVEMSCCFMGMFKTRNGEMAKINVEMALEIRAKVLKLPFLLKLK